jgi:hypothetical protein
MTSSARTVLARPGFSPQAKSTRPRSRSFSGFNSHETRWVFFVLFFHFLESCFCFVLIDLFVQS